MSDDLVFSKQSCMVNHDGQPVRLKQNEAWYKSDPFVQRRPDLFADEPTRVQGTRGHGDIPGGATSFVQRDVEDARQAPGEKRGGRSRG